MISKEKPLEQRRSARFRIRGCVLASLNAERMHLGEVLDIGLGGLGLRCVSNKRPVPQDGTLGIYGLNDGLILSRIPFSTVWDRERADIAPLDYIQTRRYGVRFGPLTRDQKSALRSAIRHHTAADPES